MSNARDTIKSLRLQLTEREVDLQIALAKIESMRRALRHRRPKAAANG